MKLGEAMYKQAAEQQPGGPGGPDGGASAEAPKDDVVDAEERQPRKQKERDDDIDRRIAVEIGKQQDQGNRDDRREDEESCRQRQQQSLHETTPRIGGNHIGESNPPPAFLRVIRREPLQFDEGSGRPASVAPLHGIAEVV